MDLRWRHYLWKEMRPVPPGEIEKLGLAWGVKLPDEYKKMVALYQGMAPAPGAFRLGRGENVFSVLLTITRDEDYDSYSVWRAYEVMRPHVPSGLYPFGDTPGGEPLCFDYRASSEQPGIVFISVEMSIYPVANSFREFLEGLFDD